MNSPRSPCSDLTLQIHRKTENFRFTGKQKTKVPDMKKLIPVSCFLLMALIGRNANAIDLLEIFQQAQRNDAAYAAAQAQYQAQQERLPQARAGLLPNVNFDAGYDWNDLDVQYSSVQFNSGQRDFESYDYGISISQPLFRRQNRLGYDQAKIQVTQAETDLELANQDLVLRTATAYFDILRARANVTNIRSLKSARERDEYSLAEELGKPATRTSQAQLRRWHGHHHRPARSAGALRPGDCPGNWLPERTAGEHLRA